VTHIGDIVKYKPDEEQAYEIKPIKLLASKP
jgi:hypothetical protein